MISRTEIFNNLKSLDVKYRKTSSSKDTLFFSKLALLELCGWIEESMDDIVLRCANRKLKESQNKKFVIDGVTGPVYGFEYKKHFRKMLIQLIGIINVERLEIKVDALKRDSLKSELGNLKEMRNKMAHTHIKGITTHIDSPSITIRRFNVVYDGLKDFELIIRGMKL